jgi:hypothetical protein
MMSASGLSARWQLPLLAAAQMQKEVTHNEALALIDALIAPVAEGAGVNTPPATPVVGQCWVIGSAPTGVWTGAAQRFACWTEGGWRLIAPRAGMMVRVTAIGMLRYDGGQWVNPPSLAAPTGGSVVDAEGRAAIAALAAALRSQGWAEQN